MDINRTENEILIKLPLDTGVSGIQRLLDNIKFRQITAKSKANKAQIEALTKEVKADWNKRNQKIILD